MDDLATRYADFLEGVAARVRGLTVDRILRLTKLLALGVVAAALAVTALVLLSIGVFRLAAHWLGALGAYLLFAGLFLVGGALAWSMRRRSEDSTP